MDDDQDPLTLRKKIEQTRRLAATAPERPRSGSPRWSKSCPRAMCWRSAGARPALRIADGAVRLRAKRWIVLSFGFLRSLKRPGSAPISP